MRKLFVPIISKVPDAFYRITQAGAKTLPCENKKQIFEGFLNLKEKIIQEFIAEQKKSQQPDLFD